jgi:hypothetical protein
MVHSLHHLGDTQNTMYRVLLEKLIVSQLVKTFSISDKGVTQLVLIPWAFSTILFFSKRRKTRTVDKNQNS